MNFSSSLILPKRLQKPRQTGLTEIMDVGTPTMLFKDYINDFHPFIDFIKFGIGSGLITPNLKDKILFAKKYDIQVWFGGTLFEKFLSQDRLNEYLDFLRQYEINWIEISSGTLGQSHDEVLKIVEQLKSEFYVVAEVGSKESSKIMPPSQWIKEIQNLLTLDCKYIILEGRESATAGLYRKTGEIRDGLIADIVNNIAMDKLIFEAPTPSTQNHFIKHFGTNVNFGNVKFTDILLLESQRFALRNETFFIT